MVFTSEGSLGSRGTFSSNTRLQSFLAIASEGSLRYQKGEYMRPPKGFPPAVNHIIVLVVYQRLQFWQPKVQVPVEEVCQVLAPAR